MKDDFVAMFIKGGAIGALHRPDKAAAWLFPDLNRWAPRA